MSSPERRLKELPHSEKVTTVLIAAEVFARLDSRVLITPGDILSALIMQEGAFTKVFQERDIANFVHYQAVYLQEHRGVAKIRLPYSPRSKWVFESANTEAQKSGQRELTPDLLLKAVVREGQLEGKESRPEQVKA